MAAQSTYTPIYTYTVPNNTTQNFTLTTIPQTYTDLVVTVQSSNYTAAYLEYLDYGVGGGNISSTILYNNGPTSKRRQTDYYIIADDPYGMNTSTTSFGTYTYQIMNYANTTTYKTILSEFSSTQTYRVQSVTTVRYTNAVTQINVGVGSGYWRTGTIFSVYGIGAA
jgi:hypothetical protein